MKSIIVHMKTAQKNTRLIDSLVTAFARYASCGFDSFRHRIADQLSLQGFELSEEDDETLLSYYRHGENETYVLAAFGYEN